MSLGRMSGNGPPSTGPGGPGRVGWRDRLRDRLRDGLRIRLRNRLRIRLHNRRPGGWQHRWRHRVGHSLKARLVLLFLALALGTTALFFWAAREPFSVGWRELARPLISDYIDRLAAEIGSPPDIARAAALTRRLPLSVRIDGPQVNWASHPAAAPRHGVPPGNSERSALLLSRTTADGHRIRFGVGDWRWDDHPGGLGWTVLGGLLCMTALAYGCVRRLFRPLDDIRAGALRYGEGNFSQAIPLRRRDELGDLAAQVNTMASRLQRMPEGQRGLLLAISHDLRSQLTCAHR